MRSIVNSRPRAWAQPKLKQQEINVRRRTEQPEIDSTWPQEFPRRRSTQSDYEPVRRSRHARATVAATMLNPLASVASPVALKETVSGGSASQPESPASKRTSKGVWMVKRGHALSYAGLVLFTVVLYARPAEFYTSRLTASLAL